MNYTGVCWMKISVFDVWIRMGMLWNKLETFCCQNKCFLPLWVMGTGSHVGEPGFAVCWSVKMAFLNAGTGSPFVLHLEEPVPTVTF